MAVRMISNMVTRRYPCVQHSREFRMLYERPRIAEAVDITDAVTHQRVRYFLHDRSNALTVRRMRARPKRNIIESKGHAHRISVPQTRNMSVNFNMESRGSRPPARGSKRKRRTEGWAQRPPA